MQWSRVFLLNKSFTTFSGKNAGRALLFPMEQVFEAFVAKKIKLLFENQSAGTFKVSAQDSGYYLFDEPRKFKLRPDIVIRSNADDVQKIVIMDTKWKKLNHNPSSNYEISQSDMYQMYAYSKKYNTPDIWLIYPVNEDVCDMDPITFEAIKDEITKVSVKVFFVDLENYRDSLTVLFNRINQFSE